MHGSFSLLCRYNYMYQRTHFAYVFEIDIIDLIPSDKWNEMNGVLGHLCAHVGKTGPGEPLDGGEMNEMTLPSRLRIRNSSHGSLRPSTLPLGHGSSPQYIEALRVSGETHFVSYKLEGQSGVRTCDFRLSKEQL